MALLIVTGLPSSGRSTRVEELTLFLEDKIKNHPILSNVQVVRGEDVHADLHVYECVLDRLTQHLPRRAALVLPI